MYAQKTMILDGFQYARIASIGADLNVAWAGKGPPLLLLHGYPQTHLAWHRVAPVLARSFTVVAPDLRGYGDSVVSEPGPAGMSKRAMALDQLAVMHALG